MKRLLPVIHLRDPEHTLAQVAIAVECGADGVWLINHAGSSESTFGHFARVRHRNPDVWVGLNLLDLTAHSAMRIVTTSFARGNRIDGLWADDAGVTDEGVAPRARLTWKVKEETGWPGEYFGSVAFKAGPEILHPAQAAEVAGAVMDVVTTSGPATGVPADVDKVRTMKRALGDHRLAVASGITPDNVGDYLPFVDDYLVATGISRDFHTLDPAKVRALAEAVHAGG